MAHYFIWTKHIINQKLKYKTLKWKIINKNIKNNIYYLVIKNKSIYISFIVIIILFCDG